MELCRSFEQTSVVSEFRFGNLRYHLSDFATLIYIIDDSKRTRWSFPFLVVGVNPLSIYIFSEIAGGLFRKLQWTTISFEGIWQPLFGNYGGSLAYALAFLMFNWLIAFFLYKKHIYIKL